ncbi:hypothetical protein JCM6882_003952 [Rhodosporidiobolus microsporus]
MSTSTADGSAAPPVQKPSLRLDVELLAKTPSSSVGRTRVYGVDLDFERLTSRCNKHDTKHARSPLPDEPARGGWYLQIVTKTSSLQLLVWRGRTVGPFVTMISISTFASSDNKAWELLASTFVHSEDVVLPQGDITFERASLDLSASKLKPDKAGNARFYRLEVTWFAFNLFSFSSGLPTERHPHNVRLFFPAVDGELWANSAILAHLSPFFKDLLESDFSEGIERHTKRRRLDDASADVDKTPSSQEEQKTSTPAASEKDYDDSDDDLDDLVQRTRPTLLSSPSSTDGVSYQQITVRHAAWSTYRALLSFLLTHNLPLGTLQSARHASLPVVPTSFTSILESGIDRPLPVSPKSLYRLAHLLQLPDVTSRCLLDFRRQLSPSNAAVELFGDVAADYDELRAVAMRYTVEHWSEVKESEGMKEVRSKIKSGELPRAGEVLMELMDKLEERRDGGS